MEQVKVTIKNKEYSLVMGESLLDLIGKEFPNAANNIVAAKTQDGSIIDLMTSIKTALSIDWISPTSDDGLRILRHSASHIMAQAICKLFPDTKLAIGPSIENGFYYDLDSSHRFSEEDFASIEKEMQAIIDENQLFEKEYIDKEEALEKFRKLNEKYKVELIKGLDDSVVSIYKNGNFSDLCKGPHVPSTKFVRSFKIMKVAGAYWRGDEKKEMLQRLYGTAFYDKKSLKKHLNFLEEAAKRDHRKIGKEMDLFSFYPEGPGFPFWKPNGMILYNTVVDYWKRIHNEAGYLEVKTPIFLNEELWHRSGHWDHYKENMYFTKIDENAYAVKPMNCPGGLLIYRDGIHSYKELPLKVAELGLVHRHEKSGVLHGLFRVRQFTQDDAHIYCQEDQIKDEVATVIKLIQRIYSDFGFDSVHIELSTRPENSIGSDEIWETAEKSLADSLDFLNLEYQINPGDGAFYGPKIDFHIKDSIGRRWQCGTIQCDFSMPERFDISYIGPDGQKHRPVMLHRAILGSVERFIGILIEHYYGKFPFWLAIEQVRILPIAENHNNYAKEVKNILQNFEFRVKVDSASDTLGSKIKNARLDRVYFVAIVGDNEINKKSLTLRKADGSQNIELKLDEVADYLLKLKNEKK